MATIEWGNDVAAANAKPTRARRDSSQSGRAGHNLSTPFPCHDFLLWIVAEWNRRRRERRALRYRYVCVICAFEFEDRTATLLPRCPRCGSLNEDLDWSKFNYGNVDRPNRKARVTYGFDEIALVPGRVTINPNEVDIGFRLPRKTLIRSN